MRALLLHLLDLAYFMAPAYCANMAAPFARYWPGWNRPIHRRSLGGHKTVVGFLLGVTAALATTAMQRGFDVPFARVDYAHWVMLGLGFGIGAMGGDALKSLIKRRLQRPPGTRWMPFDQIDFALGALMLVGPWAVLDAIDVAAILGLTFLADIAVSRIAWRLHIKDVPW